MNHIAGNGAGIKPGANFSAVKLTYGNFEEGGPAAGDAKLKDAGTPMGSGNMAGMANSTPVNGPALKTADVAG